MNRHIRRYLTKHAPANTTALSRTNAMMKFIPATEAELKALNLTGDTIPEGYVAGWASTPDLDLYHHVVVTGAFDDAIAKRGLIGPKSIKLLICHDWDKVAGVIKVLETRGGKLWIEAQLNLAISYARDAYEACKMAQGLNFSVGFMLQDYEFQEDADGNYEFLQINRGDLFEVSIVPFPGNEEATMDYVKSAHAALQRQDPPTVTTIAEFEKSLIVLGLVKCRNDAKRITQAVKNACHLFRAEEQAPAPVVTEPVPPETLAQPVLAATQLDELTSLVAKMRAVIAPVATN